MGYRDTGKRETLIHRVTEQFCDVCGDTIPEQVYPALRVHVDLRAHEKPGDSVCLEVCSAKCAARLGDELDVVVARRQAWDDKEVAQHRELFGGWIRSV